MDDLGVILTRDPYSLSLDEAAEGLSKSCNLKGEKAQVASNKW